MIQPHAVWADVEKLRETAPLVHNITNFVVMNTTANALLAIGASPVMAHAAEEVTDMVAIASALVINIGTLSPDWVDAMRLAMSAASKKKIPIVFDPVGAGATPYRTNTCKLLLNAVRPTIIRGNASEIMALLNEDIKTKGVDSTMSSVSAQDAAKALAIRYQCVVVVSGEIDVITDGTDVMLVKNGHPMMPKVTGMGCTATALIGAFAAIQPNPLLAATHAMAVMSICGEMAARHSAGPATLQLHIIDSFYNLTRSDIDTILI